MESRIHVLGDAISALNVRYARAGSEKDEASSDEMASPSRNDFEKLDLRQECRRLQQFLAVLTLD